MLGFRDDRTREWKTLLEILRNKNHCYCVGFAHTKEYDQNRNILKQINIKLIRSFSKIFNIQIPENFQLYELDQSEKSGTYRFKFHVIDEIADSSENTYNRYSDEQLLSEIESFRKKNKKQSLDTIERDKASILLTISFKKKLINKGQVEIIFKELQKPSKVEEIEDEFRELAESSKDMAIKDYARLGAHRNTDID